MPPEKDEFGSNESAQDEFMQGVKSDSDQEQQQDPFAEPAQDAGTEVKPEGELESAKPTPRKNREHRRLESKYQAEREANIALSARVQALSEAKQFSTEFEIDERLVRLYGSEEQGKEAAKLHQAILDDMARKAEERALERLEARSVEAAKEQKAAEQFIDNELETLEDDFNVDLTSDAPAARKARRELLELVAKLSPKDDEGNVKDYADFGEAFELYRSRQGKPDATANKALASRGMQKSGTSQPSKLENDAHASYLKKIGVLD